MLLITWLKQSAVSSANNRMMAAHSKQRGRRRLSLDVDPVRKTSSSKFILRAAMEPSFDGYPRTPPPQRYYAAC
jgi:hypothetical protein